MVENEQWQIVILEELILNKYANFKHKEIDFERKRNRAAEIEFIILFFIEPRLRKKVPFTFLFTWLVKLISLCRKYSKETTF